jgi:hypothetical protein
MALPTVRYETHLPRQTAACCGFDCCPGLTTDFILRRVVLAGHGAHCMGPRQFLQFLGTRSCHVTWTRRDQESSHHLMDCATRDNSGRKEILFKK